MALTSKNRMARRTARGGAEYPRLGFHRKEPSMTQARLRVATTLLLVALVVPALAGDGLFPVSTGTPADPDMRLMPAIAYNTRHDEYLVVWVNSWPGGHEDIYAQRISANGTFIGPWYCVSCGGNDRWAPSVAYDWDSDQYLLVWMYDASGSNSRWEVRGKSLPRTWQQS
jgi:hypothetical protein